MELRHFCLVFVGVRKIISAFLFVFSDKVTSLLISQLRIRIPHLQICPFRQFKSSSETNVSDHFCFS